MWSWLLRVRVPSITPIFLGSHGCAPEELVDLHRAAVYALNQMKRLLGFVVTLWALPVFAQTLPHLQETAAQNIDKQTPQQLADVVSEEVRANPAGAPGIVRKVVQSLVISQGMDPGDAKKRVAAVVAAAVAAAPGVRRESIVAAAAGVAPVFGVAAADAEDSVAAAPVAVPGGADSAQMLLGNIRVLFVEGREVECIDAQGKASKPKAGDFLRQGVRISTGAGGRVDLVFENGSAVSIGPDSEFAVEKFTQAPFAGGGLDYRSLGGEPSASNLRASLARGGFSFDVAKLKKSSAYEIVTPVGVAGIRGTGGFASSKAGNANQPVAFGLYEGSASFTTPVGQAQNVERNESIGVGGAGSNFLVEANPPGGAGALEAARQAMAKASSYTTAQPFTGAPPAQAAPPDPIALLPVAQQRALLQAAEEGYDALVEAAADLAARDPAAAAEIAAAAADLRPSAAAGIAATLAMAFPGEATSISAAVSIFVPVQAAAIASLVSLALPGQSGSVAAAVAAVAPSQAADIASSVSVVFPSEAAGVAAAIAEAVPSRASSIASAVAIGVPAQAAAVAASVALVVPGQAAAVAAAVARAVPAQASSVASAVAVAVPSQAKAVEAAVEAATQGGDAPASANPVSPAANQNPAILPISTPSPAPVSPSF